MSRHLVIKTLVCVFQFSLACVLVLFHLNGLLAPAIGPRLLQVWEPSIEHNCGDDGGDELCGGRRWGCTSVDAPHLL